MQINQIDSTRSRGVSRVVVACVCATAGILLSRLVVRELPLLPFVFLQATSAAVVTWAACFWLSVVPPLRELPPMSIPGLFQPGLTYVLFFAALPFIPLALESSLSSVETIFVLLLSYPLLRERPTVLQLWICLAAAFGLLLLSQTGGVPGEHVILGVVLALGAVLCASLDTITSRVLAQQSHPVVLAAACSTSGTLVATLALAFVPRQNWSAFASIRVLTVTMLSGILIHGLGASFFNLALSRVTATQAALLFPIISLLTAIGGITLFRERLTGTQVVGSIIVLASTAAAAITAEGR